MSKKLRYAPAVAALLAATPAAAHIGNHEHVGAWHFVTQPVHILPVLVLAAVVVAGLVTRARRREKARRRIDES